MNKQSSSNRRQAAASNEVLELCTGIVSPILVFGPCWNKVFQACDQNRAKFQTILLKGQDRIIRIHHASKDPWPFFESVLLCASTIVTIQILNKMHAKLISVAICQQQFT